MHLPLLFTTLAFCRSCAAADPMTVKNPLLTLTEENADALSQSASMDGYTAVYSPMFQLGSYGFAKGYAGSRALVTLPRTNPI